MMSRQAEGAVETSEVFQLLEKYCSKSSWQEFRCCYAAGGFSQAPAKHTAIANSEPFNWSVVLQNSLLDSDSDERSYAYCENLVEDGRLSKSGTSHEANMDDIIQRMVELIKAQGDDIDRKIKQNLDLQQKLSDLDYDMFKKLTSGVQSLVEQTGWAAASEEQIQRQKIVLAFEMTSRLSALSVVHRRRVLSFGEQYIEENHSDWVEHHGGWAEAFSVD